MDFKALIFFGLMIAFAFPSSAEDSNLFWILEAATPLRSQPKAQSEVKTYLRTGTGFYSSKRSADWIYMGTSHEKSPYNGWVPASAVSETQVDRVFLVKQIRQAKSNADSISWLVRIVSLQPESTAYLKALQKVYASSGDTAKAAHYGRELRGTNPIYLARFDGEDVLVFGAIDSTGGFRNLLWSEEQDGSDRTKFAIADDSSRAIKKRALALRDTFASSSWYACGGYASPGDRVWDDIFPKVGPDRKKTEEFYVDSDGRATFGISLGSSHKFHNHTTWQLEVIFATRPAFRVPISGIKSSTGWDSLARYRKDLVGPLFDSSGISELGFSALPEYGYVDIRMQGRRNNGFTKFEHRGIYDGRGNRVWPPIGQTTFNEEEQDLGRLRSPTEWFRFGPDASYPAFIILPFTDHYEPPNFQEGENGSEGYQLLRLEIGRLKAFTIQAVYGGC